MPGMVWHFSLGDVPYMTTRSEIEATIKFLVNRGDTLDTYIPVALENAISFFEQNNNLNYMHRLVRFTVVYQEGELRFLPMPPQCKAFEFIRFRLPDGRYWHLRKIHPQEFAEDDDRELPNGFWLDGNKRIILESVPTDPLAGQMGYWRYTDFSTLTSDSTHWLFDNARGAIIARTMLEMIPAMNAPELRELYVAQLTEALKTLNLAEHAFREGPTAAAEMIWDGN